jgi:predicted DNA-binding protein
MATPKRPISLKIDDARLRLLDKLSKTTGIPKSAIVRRGIDLIVHQLKEDVLSVQIREEIDAVIREDKALLKKLAEA